MRLGLALPSRTMPAHNWAVAYALYATASLPWTSGDHLWAPVYLGSLVIAYVIGAYFKDISLVWAPLFAAIILNQAFCIYAWFGMEWYSFGLFGNSNYMGTVLAVTIAIAIGHQAYWYLPFAGFGLWWCQSRGALIAAAVIFLIGLWKRFPVTAYISALLCVITILAYRPDAGTSMFERLGVWQDTINHLTFFGHGFASFPHEAASWSLRHNMLAIPPHAYNDFLEILFDTGFASFFLWLAIIQNWAKGPWESKLVLVAFGILGLTYFPLYVPLTAHIAAAALGQLTRSNQWHAGA